MFSSNQCTVGYGAVKGRDDPKQYNSSTEKMMVTHENALYAGLASECIKSRVCVDLFFAIPHSKSIDVAQMAPVANMTGGDLHYIYNYEDSKHSERLYYLLYRLISRT